VLEFVDRLEFSNVSRSLCPRRENELETEINIDISTMSLITYDVFVRADLVSLKLR
jgi:hypothetical protein